MSSGYDVIVVGAGPAGAMAAYQAAKGGAKTILLEKHERVGLPICCAEGITTFGLERVIKPRQEWIASKIHAARLEGPFGISLTLSQIDAGYILYRDIFDKALADLALDSGAAIALGSPVTGLRRVGDEITGVEVSRDGSTEIIKGRIVIAADGIESRVASMAGLHAGLNPGEVGSACQYLIEDIPIEPEKVVIIIGNEIAPGGYAWIFPKSASSANIGVTVCPVHAGGRPARNYLDNFLKSRFGSYKVIKMMMGVVPTYDGALPLVIGNLMLVGDAARVVDSLSQAGISNAILSGSLAGSRAARFLHGEGTLGDYQREFLRLKARELRAYKLFRSLFVKANDDEFRDIVEALNRYFPEKNIRNINIPDIIFRLVFRNPGLLKMARHLIAR